MGAATSSQHARRDIGHYAAHHLSLCHDPKRVLSSTRYRPPEREHPGLAGYFVSGHEPEADRSGTDHSERPRRGYGDGLLRRRWWKHDQYRAPVHLLEVA